MATQTSFVERTPEQKSEWVEQQRALGNPKILPKDEWFKRNGLRIEVSNLRKEVKSLRDVVLKLVKSK